MNFKQKLAALGAAAMIVLLGCTPSMAAETTVGVFDNTYKPAVAAETSDTAKVELGMKFSPTTSGTLTGIQFYRNVRASGTASASLWDSTGKLLTKVAVSTTGDTGWRTVPVNVALTAGKSYTVSVFDNNGAYPNTPAYFTSAKTVNGINVPANAGVYRYGSTSAFPSQSWNGSNYLVDVVYKTDLSTTPTPTPDPTPTPTPDPTPPPTGPTQYNYLGRSWPDPSTTGVPAGTVLTDYTGPCTITVDGTVIDKKRVTNCDDFRVFAHNVIIKNSEFHMRIYVDDGAGAGSMTVSDTTVISPQATATGIGDVDFTAIRVKVTGGNRGIACYRNCTVQDSYVVGGYRDDRGLDHMSGIRVNTNSHLVHNTVGCSAPDIGDAGCSAAITGYPDFDPVSGNVIDNNLILAESGGYCAYGGSTLGKPYSGQTHDITFKNNVWQRGPTGRGCWYGPITSFDVNAPGNVWTNNLWEDGAAVPPAN